MRSASTPSFFLFLSPADQRLNNLFSKLYTTENSYRSHIQSKKHRENEAKAALKPARQPVQDSDTVDSAPEAATSAPTQQAPVEPVSAAPIEEEPTESANADVNAEEGNSDDELIQSIDRKIAAARSRLSDNNCLFCNVVSPSLDDNLTHMSIVHSFFIPDAEYLVDISGLITYLGEKIAVGNVCIFCNQKGREFRTMDAVRKHMIDKSHCKIAYEREKDRLEISDFYDFTSSYPDADKMKDKTLSKVDDDDDWEDTEDIDDDEVDEIVDESDSEGSTESDSDEDSEDDLVDNQLTYGDSPFELVLPSGARIGHRTMRRYYAQSFPGAPRGSKPEDPNSGAALVRRLLADKNSALVPSRGGFGAFGRGTEVVKARNRGEAREAGRHVREFRDQKRREDFKTKVGFIHNSQKHYRDPRESKHHTSHVDIKLTLFFLVLQ